MTKSVHKVTATGYIPVDEDAIAEHRRCKLGQLVMMDPKRHRNIKHHNKFMALCRLVYRNTERYPSAEAVRDMLLIATGHRDEYQSKDGKSVTYIPHHINFATMDQTEFEPLYERVIDLVCTKVIPNLEAGPLRAAIEELCGIGAPA